MEIAGIQAIVTGAGGGIGRATCAMLLEAGAAKVGMLGRDSPSLTQAHAELAEKHGADRVAALRADVRDAQQVQTAIKQWATESGGLRLLVNNAGVLRDGALYAVSFRGPVLYPAEKWHETLDTNLTGAFHVTQEALKIMTGTKNVPAGQSKGVIVNMSSVSRVGRAGQAAYSAAKAGLVAFTLSLAQELMAHHIRSVALAPGLIDTPMALQIPEAYRQEMLARVAQKRMGRPEEIAHGIKFCIENEFFNGRVLELDGGAF